MNAVCNNRQKKYDAKFFTSFLWCVLFGVALRLLIMAVYSFLLVAVTWPLPGQLPTGMPPPGPTPILATTRAPLLTRNYEGP